MELREKLVVCGPIQKHLFLVDRPVRVPHHLYMCAVFLALF